MASQRVVLQPAIEIGVDQEQDSCCAVPARGAKTALFWVNVLRNTSADAVKVSLRGSSSLSLLDGGGGAAPSSYWLVLKQLSAGTAVGAFSGVVPTLPDFLGWQVEGITGASPVFQFEAVLYLYDT